MVEMVISHDLQNIDCGVCLTHERDVSDTGVACLGGESSLQQSVFACTITSGLSVTSIFLRVKPLHYKPLIIIIYYYNIYYNKII